MRYVFLAIIGAIGVYFVSRQNIAIVDNAKNSVGLENTDNVSSSDKTIAATNNNPLNIRGSSDNWVGLANPRIIKGFFNFQDVVYCYRAASHIILNSYASRNVKTIEQVISTWAPATENNTAQYIDFVVNKMGANSGDFVDSGNIANLLYAMTIVESGHAQPLSVINQGINL